MSNIFKNMSNVAAKRILIGVVSAAVLCAGFGSGYLIAEKGGVDEFLEETILSKDDKKSDKNKTSSSKKKNDKTNAEAAGSKKNGAAGAGGSTQKTGYVDNGGASVGGTSASDSYSIKMSDLCTFSDPSGISFDTRYTLYGGSDCMPAKKAASVGYNCQGVYVILYAAGGKAAGQYTCYVMSSEGDAQGLASAMASANDSGDFSYGNWGDVAYEYCSGSYVQTSIDTYYKAGAITAATPQAYLGMQFYFGGMSEYQPSSGSGGGTGNPGVSNNPGNPSNPSNPSRPSNPSNPSNPNNPSNPSNPSNPNNPNNPSVPVKTSSLKGTTPAGAFAVQIGNSRFFDPAGISYDYRYVLRMDSSAGSFDRYGGEGATEFYEILYAKGDTVTAEYEGYVMKDIETAKKKADDNKDSIKIQSIQTIGNVVVFRLKAEFTQNTIKNMQGALKGAGWKAPFHKAYLEEMYVSGGMKEYRKDSFEDTLPEPASELIGTIPAESFSIKMNESFTFDEEKSRPNDYGVRYVLYTNIEQQGMKENYLILYTGSDGKALLECNYMIMESAAKAEEMKDLYESSGFAAGYKVEGNILYQHNKDVQQTIDQLAGIGMLKGATGQEYLKVKMSGQMGPKMIELISFTGTDTVSALSMMVTDVPLTEKNTDIHTDNTLATAAEKAGIKPETALPDVLTVSEELVSDELVLADDVTDALSLEENPPEKNFDPSEAGNVTDDSMTEPPDTPSEENIFGPSETGNTGAEADETVIEPVPEIPAETFDPSTAGNTGTVTESSDTPSEPQPDPKDIHITTEYTYKDPEGLTYNERFVYYGASDSVLAVQAAEEIQTAVSDIYLIVYVKDGKVLTEYRCYIADNQVICNETKPEDLEALMNSLPEMETPYEASPNGYRSFMEQAYGLKDMGNEG